MHHRFPSYVVYASSLALILLAGIMSPAFALDDDGMSGTPDGPLAASSLEVSVINTIDFETCPAGTLTSYSEDGATVTGVGGGGFQCTTSPAGSRSVLNIETPREETKIVFPGLVSAVSVDLGDFDGDADLLFVEAFTAGNVLVNSQTLLIDSAFTGMKTLTVSGANIAYIITGARAPAVNGASVFIDNVAFTLQTAFASPPVANDDTFTTQFETPANNLNVLLNDTDADFDTLTISAVGSTLNGGTAVINATSTGINFTPATGFRGVDRFNYTVFDGNNGTDTATVTMVILGTNGKIAFATNRDGNFEIYSMNTDGTGQTRLINNAAFDIIPSWSPDGTKIAFKSDRDGNDEIYVMNSDGTGQTNLSNNPAFDSAPSWSPDGTKIAFQSFRDGNNEIYVMNSDGTGQTRLTNNAAADIGPSWSPDGTKITFQSTRDGNDEIYTMNSDGTGQTNLSNNAAADQFPSWSPDGTKIAFTSTRDGNGEIYVMNSDGTGQTRITNNPAVDQLPSWSPDGTKIVFTSNRDGNFEIYTMNSDGTAQTRLTNNVAFDTQPDWGTSPNTAPNNNPVANDDKYTTSQNTPLNNLNVLQNDTDADGNILTITSVTNPPFGTAAINATSKGINYTPDTGFRGVDRFNYTISDGNNGTDTATVTMVILGTNGKIAFVSNRDSGNVEIYSMNSDGTEQTRLTNNAASDAEPSWSPDGTKIAFLTTRDGNRQIYVMNSDGTAQTRLTNNAASDIQPSWSPDGTKIAFGSTRDGNFQIYVMNSDGTSQTRITNNAANDSDPSWSPDGTKIVFRSGRDGNDEIYVMNSDGTGQTRLTNNAASDLDPGWSPDGTKIVFRSNRDALSGEIYTMNADGTGQTRITNNAVSDARPSWSPDGTKIAFGSTRDALSGEIYTMNADGTTVTRLTNNAASDADPSWGTSPNMVLTISFDEDQYAIEDGAFVTVTDSSLGSNLISDTVNISVQSTSDAVVFLVTLAEIGDSGTFINSNIIKFTSDASNSGANELHVSVGDTVTAQYGTISDTATIFVPGAFGVLPSATDPVRWNTDVFTVETAGTLKVLDLAANLSPTVIDTINVQVSTPTDPGFLVTLVEDSANAGTFTSENMLWFSAGTSDSSIPRIHVNVPQRVDASYNGIVASAVVIAPAGLPQVGNPVDTTLRLACDDDADRDGLCDTWEQPTGLVIPKQDGGDYVVACNPNATYDPAAVSPFFYNALGNQICPSPQKKDVYVEIDFIRNHRPSDTALTQVVNSFRNAPPSNPDGTTGINLHILIGDRFDFHLDNIPLDGDAVNPGFNELKESFFGTAAERTAPAGTADPVAYVSNVLTAKRQAFHYVMFIHGLSDTPNSSGYAEKPGNDVIVSLGSFAGGVGSVDQQAGTLMHELGHNFGLSHAGPVAGTFNCKPNYISVMNYLFQFPDFVTDRHSDYSRQRMPSYFESSLSEQTGFGLASPLGLSTVIGGKDAAGNVLAPLVVSTDGTVDWNHNTQTESGTYQQNTRFFDIDGCRSEGISGVGGYDDWINIDLAFRDDSEFADGLHTSPPALLELTALTSAEMRAAVGTPEPLPAPGSDHQTPFAADQSVITAKDTPVAIVLIAGDPNTGDTLTYTVSDPSHGILSGTAPNLTYTPDASYVGPDSFTFFVTDSTGLVSETAIVSITVGQNIAPVLGPINAPIDPIAVGTQFTASASFTDENSGDTHTAVWDWGDGTTPGTVTESGGSGSVSNTHTYTIPGVYTLTLTVDDGNGGTDTEQFQFVVAYDPAAGFVTGAGSIDSPAGAYAADPTLTGKASFGFVSKYQKGQTIPTGSTKFQFKTGDLDFKSALYDWLVVSGAKAQYKGSGTINGAGDYGFMLTLIDGQISGGGGLDKFRIKIWDKATDSMVYDNQLEASDGADPATVIASGSIKIHKT